MSIRVADIFNPRCSKQHGAALMVMLVIMVMGAVVFLVSSLSRSALQIQNNQNSTRILAQAKEEVMGNILGGVGGQIPGNLLTPDMLSISELPPYNYDGTANGGCLDASKPGSSPTPGLPLVNSGANMRCLGRLPWKAYGMSISSPSENDPSGTMPWYAVSANLVDPLNVIFNPGLLNSNPAHPWLTIRDMKGNVLSNRVAIVIIVPGSVLSGQSRPSSPLGGPNQYLDSIQVPVGCNAPCVPGTYNNFGLDDDFIMGDERRWIPDPNNPATQIEDNTYQFNDKLIYITIDELMPEIVKRAAGEARSILKSYYSAKNRFPDAALLGSAGTYSAVPSNDSGMLPINLGTCSCSAFTSCACNFSLVASTAFKRGSTSTWSATNVFGACTRTSSQVCTCTGAGYCQNASGSRNFTCDSSGNCTNNTTSGTYIFTPPSYGTLSSLVNACSLNGSNAECNGNGSFTINLKLPSWFTDNLWQDFFYYHRSNTSSLKTGIQGNIQALLIGTSVPITSVPFASKGSAQTRPSSNINDYLDSAENTNGDLLFDATNKSLSSSYNDQVFIVAP